MMRRQTWSPCHIPARATSADGEAGCLVVEGGGAVVRFDQDGDVPGAVGGRCRVGGGDGGGVGAVDGVFAGRRADGALGGGHVLGGELVLGERGGGRPGQDLDAL